MVPVTHRHELIERLHYTFITAPYQEIDKLILALQKKDNFEELCEEFFTGCVIDQRGRLIPKGFFVDERGSASLIYALYELLGTAPETFLLKHRVTRVVLRHRDLAGTFRIPKALFTLPRLESLTLTGIGITRLPPDLKKAGNLKFLDLQSNQFEVFPEEICRLSQLRALNLAYNQLKQLPESLGKLKRLRALNLQGNQLAALPEKLQRLQDLRLLNLSMNRLSALPASLGTIVSLVNLQTGYNNLSSAEEAAWEGRFPLEASGNQDNLSLGV